MISSINRTFSAIYNTQHGAPGLGYVFNPYLPITGQNGIQSTGAWLPIGTNVFTELFSGIYTGQMTIPVGVKQFSIITQSGTTYINGNPTFVGPSVYQGGGFDGNQYLSTPIVVGQTGGFTTVAYEF